MLSHFRQKQTFHFLLVKKKQFRKQKKIDPHENSIWKINLNLINSFINHNRSVICAALFVAEIVKQKQKEVRNQNNPLISSSSANFKQQTELLDFFTFSTLIRQSLARLQLIFIPI